MILGYQVFKTNDDFIEWQKSEKRVIQNISPIVISFDMGMEGKSTIEGDKGDAQANAGIGVFVTYFEKDET